MIFWLSFLPNTSAHITLVAADHCCGGSNGALCCQCHSFPLLPLVLPRPRSLSPHILSLFFFPPPLGFFDLLAFPPSQLDPPPFVIVVSCLRISTSSSVSEQ